MPHVIDSTCVNCGTCESECPTDSISDNGTQHVINPDTCIDCGACAAVCPTGAISQM